jgi:hypothetical protein
MDRLIKVILLNCLPAPFDGMGREALIPQSFLVDGCYLGDLDVGIVVDKKGRNPREGCANIDRRLWARLAIVGSLILNYVNVS